MPQIQYLNAPEFRVSYRGCVDYHVGKYVPGIGSCKVSAQYRMLHTEPADLNHIESYWQTEVKKVGTIWWAFHPYSRPSVCALIEDKVAKMFPDFCPCRYSDNYEVILYRYDIPQLVATPHAIIAKPFVHENESGRIFWEGTPADITFEFWLNELFPQMDSFSQNFIATRFKERGINELFGQSLEPIFAIAQP